MVRRAEHSFAGRNTQQKLCHVTEAILPPSLQMPPFVAPKLEFIFTDGIQGRSIE